MHHILRTAILAFSSLVLTLLQPAWAQYPDKPIRMIVPQAPGSATDTAARILATALGPQLGQQIIIDNRPGGGFSIGLDLVAKAAPDGYTIGMGPVGALAISPNMMAKLPYDIEKDFVPLALLANVPQVLVVNPKSIPGDFKAFLSQLRANPGRLNYGSAGAGTSHHLAGELFKQQTKTFITHIPYTGAGPALRDLISGQVDMMFDGLGSSAAHIKGGRVKALMVSGLKRNPAFPEVPCAAELGLPDYTVTTWYGLWAPKGTPADVQSRIVDEMHRATANDELKAIWASNGADFGTLTPAQYGSFVSAEIKRWEAVVKASGAKLD